MVTAIRRWVLALGLLGLAAVPALADPPIPPLTGRVVDLAHLLDAATVATLTQRLADEEAATSNQVVVVTLPDLKGYTIEQWGLALLNGWGIGQRDKNNGVVLVVAPNDRRLRIEVGMGLEGALSNAAAADIVQNEIIPRFKGGDMKGGIAAGVDAILATVAGTYKGPLVEGHGRTGNDIGNDIDWERYWPFAVFPLIFLAFVGVMLLFRSPAAAGGGTYYPNRYDDDGWRRLDRDRPPRSFSGSSGASRGGFSGGGGRGGGGGASGRW